MAHPRLAQKTGEPAKERILVAAEKLFGDAGFNQTTARRIAQAADVPVALINYHYGSKEGLYRAIFELRAPVIRDQRVVGLKLAASEPDRDRRAELIVKALILPMFGLRDDDSGGAFGRILTRELSAPGSEGRDIFRDMFDPVAEMMLDALAECFPDWTTAEVHWAYHTMLGAMMIVMSDNGRIARLSGGVVSAEDHAVAARHMVAILTAGLKHRDRSLTAPTAASGPSNDHKGRDT